MILSFIELCKLASLAALLDCVAECDGCAGGLLPNA